METTTSFMIGKFRVIKVLGRGGMGEVLLAHDDLGRRVAIKRPFKSAEADGLARFMIEARAATLTHPNIPVVYEMGTQEDGLPYIAMEFVDGEPLDKVISSGKSLDLILKLSIIEQVCSGLAYAHEKGIIHRDIKPGNVILQPNGVTKIIDFGIAKVTNVDLTSELTQARQVIGSLHYIAPERFKAEAADGRVDVFSAGVILYLLLTGTLPFGGGEATASYRIVHEAHSGLGVHLADYPPVLDEIVDRALAKDPNDRFTAEDLADALRDVINELKRSKVSVLFDDAERLTMESRYEPALDLLDEAMKLDPANTQVRKLRKLVREHQERRRRGDRLKEFVVKAAEHLSAENYTDAIALLKEAQRIDPASTELKDKIATAEEQKRRYEASVAALSDAEALLNRGDVTAALRIVERAAVQDPENTKLLAARAAIAKQLEREAIESQVESLLDAAKRELAQQNFPAMEKLLADAEALDSSHPQIEKMRANVANLREQEERRQLLDDIHHHVNDFLRSDRYDQAAKLLTRAIERLPTEPALHRLKMEVDSAARKFDSKQVVDSAIASARQTFGNDPQKALADLQRAIEQMPGEERLLAYELSLRQQADQHRKQQQLSEALRAAREFLASRQVDRTVATLEAYQLEHGHQTDIDDLLSLALQELNGQQLRTFIEQKSAEARALCEEHPLDAIRLLESAVKDQKVLASGDRTLARLLADIQEQQANLARKMDAVEKRARLLSERGDLSEAINLLREFLSTGGRSAAIEGLLHTIEAEQERKRVTARSIQSAVDSASHGRFGDAFASLQSVVRAYGESEELAKATEQLKTTRSAHAQLAVSRSIEISRAALLNNDATAALSALREASEMVGFADTARQADWRRIAQAAKDAQRKPPKAGAVVADPLADITGTSSRKRALPIALWGGIGGACVAAVGIGIFATHKQPVTPVPATAAPTNTHISIAKVIITKTVPGALVSIDNGPQTQIDATGSLTFPVEPDKQHRLEVKMSGYDTYTEKFQVPAGETYREPIQLIPTVVSSKAGTLVMKGNIEGFKVEVDHHPHGTILSKQGTLKLEEGQHTIRYSNEDGSSPVEHSVTIAAGASFTDKFTLTPPVPRPPPPPKVGSLEVQTTPNARVIVDGQLRGTADGSGKLTVPSLYVGNHAIDISLDKQSITGRSIAVAEGQPAHFNESLPPPPISAPTTGTLSVSTNPQAQIFIDSVRRGVADSSGQFKLDIPKGGYTLTVSLDHYQNSRPEPITINAGERIVVPVHLAEIAAPAQPQPRADAGDPKPDPASEYLGIEQALRSFEQAHDSRNMDRVRATWLDIGARSKNLASLLNDKGSYDTVSIREDCNGHPVITGDIATQNCTETSKYGKTNAPNTLKKRMTFVKKNGKWIMQDKAP